MNKPDIATRDDIRDLLVAFYTTAFTDVLLGPIFVDIAQMDLEPHLPVMCDFWETALFQRGLYRGNAYIPHADLNAKVQLTWPHFERWLELWGKTVDARFAGPKADRAKQQAALIARSIHRRLSLGTHTRPIHTILQPRVPLDTAPE